MATDPQEAQAVRTREQRKWRRKAVLNSAKILYRNRTCVMQCLVLNVSEGGAKLRPADMASCPDQFTLQLDDSRARDCEVVWRKSPFLGIRFIAPWRVSNGLADLVSRKNRS
jgi:hypothetical protein